MHAFRSISTFSKTLVIRELTISYSFTASLLLLFFRAFRFLMSVFALLNIRYVNRLHAVLAFSDHTNVWGNAVMGHTFFYCL